MKSTPQSHTTGPDEVADKPTWERYRKFIKAVLKEMYQGQFRCLRIDKVTSQGIWATGYYQTIVGDNQIHFKILYRYPVRSIDDFRLMWDGPVSRRLARKFDIEVMVKGAFIEALRRTRELKLKDLDD